MSKRRQINTQKPVWFFTAGGESFGPFESRAAAYRYADARGFHDDGYSVVRIFSRKKPARQFSENPLTPNVKWGIAVVGGLVGVGLIAYFATKPAAAAALPGGTSNLVVPAKLLKGHRYTLKATAPNALVQAESGSTAASVQAAADAFGPGAFKVFSVNFATGTGGTGSMTIVFDVLADIVPAIPATATADLAGKGVSILVTDMGMTP